MRNIGILTYELSNESYSLQINQKKIFVKEVIASYIKALELYSQYSYLFESVQARPLKQTKDTRDLIYSMPDLDLGGVSLSIYT